MTILKDDMHLWRTLRSFLLAGGSPSFPKIRSFMQKYGATDCDAFFLLKGARTPSDVSKTNLGENTASGMVNNLEKLGMVEKKVAKPDPLLTCPF